MRLATVVPLALASQALAGIIPSLADLAHDVLEVADGLLHPSVFTVEEGILEHTGLPGSICTLKPTPDGEDDTDNFVNAVQRCGTNSIIILSEGVYNITRPMKMHLTNTVMEVHGWLTFSDHNLQEWIDNSFDFEFQNQKLAWIVEGENFVISGGKKGGIDGNGQVWYDYAAGFGNKHGRPMSLALRNAKNAVLEHFSIINPQFWAIITIDATNIAIDNVYVNATNYNPKATFEEKSWLQNTDGIDTYRSHNVAISNFVYQGGDDCVALKPNSTNIALSNISCYGGTGIAFGSIGQYPGNTDIIANVSMKNMYLTSSNQCAGYQGVYFKSWIGKWSGTPPNGGGGGTGYCHNVSVQNVVMENIDRPIALTSSLTYLEEEHGKYKDTGTFDWSHVCFRNVTGTSTANRAIWLDCSAAAPCRDWNFTNVDIKPGKTDHPKIAFVCNNIHQRGLDQCHENNSTRETDTGGTM